MASRETCGPAAPPIGDDRQPPTIREEPERAADPVAAAVPPGSSRSRNQAVLLDAERVREFEGLHRRVFRIRHVRVDPTLALSERKGALSARDRLVVREILAAPAAPDEEIVHRSLRLCGHAA